MNTNPETARDLLARAESYLSALHGSVARHDNLAANLGCAGCELRNQIAAELCRAAAVSVPPPAPRADDQAAVDLADGPVRCPLCVHTVTLHTPNGARAHFTAVHPEQRITGRGHGPWPLLVTDGAEAQQPDDGEGDELVCVDECGFCDACGYEPFGTPAEGWREAARFLRRTARDSGDRAGALHGARLIEAELRRLADESGPCVAGEQQNETPEADDYERTTGHLITCLAVAGGGSDPDCPCARPRP